MARAAGSQVPGGDGQSGGDLIFPGPVLPSGRSSEGEPEERQTERKGSHGPVPLPRALAASPPGLPRQEAPRRPRLPLQVLRLGRTISLKATPRLSEDKVRQCVDSRLGGDYPPKAVAKFAAVAALCVQYEADFRPNMSIVVKALQPLLNARASNHGENAGS